MINFADLPAHLKGVLVVALLFTVAIAAGAFAVSYTALFDLAEGSKTVGIVWIWPLLIDAFLIVSELALVGMAMVGGNRLLPFCFMVVMGAATIGFNLVHAPEDGGLTGMAIAAVPPLVSIGSTILIASLVKALARALGKPLSYAPPPQPTVGILGPAPGVIYRQDVAPMGGYPVALPPAGYPAIPAAQALPEARHIGHPGMLVNGNGGGGQLDEATKTKLLEEYLSTLDAEELQATTASEIRKKFAESGVDVSERWIQPILQRFRKDKAPKKWPGRRQS